MTKELEAYRRLCSHLDYDNDDYMFNGSYEEDDEVIENALKRLESIEDTRSIILGGRMSGKTANLRALAKLKAFEIIENLPEEEKQVLLNAVYTYTKSEEKYDLVKEVLL